VPKLTLITPWGRDKSNYLPTIAASIRWECVGQWVIVYDLHGVPLASPQFADNQKVVEVFLDAPSSRYGNLQRQEAINRVTDGLVYMLDDDNAMHPEFWPWFATNAFLGHIYTFDQMRGSRRNPAQPAILRGSKPTYACIDTAQILFDRALVGNVSWAAAAYGADGMFIEALVARNRAKHIYVPQILAYHNFAQHHASGAPWTRLPWLRPNESLPVYDC
jgi:hypothetical protein